MDRPIIFSGPMVRALLDGRKTQTRRVAKVKPGILIQEIDEWKPCPDRISRRAVFTRDQIAEPRFAAGDRLWVREAWRADDFDNAETIYRADAPSDVLVDTKGVIRWKPGIHMHRARSRLTLTVTDVRVQRLQDISEGDARAEGCYRQDEANPCAKPGIKGFYHDWNSINASRGFGWHNNPWVACLTFTVERRNIDGAA